MASKTTQRGSRTRNSVSLSVCLALLDSLGEAHVLTALNHRGVGGENSIIVMLKMPFSSKMRLNAAGRSCEELQSSPLFAVLGSLLADQLTDFTAHPRSSPRCSLSGRTVSALITAGADG